MAARRTALAIVAVCLTTAVAAGGCTTTIAGNAGTGPVAGLPTGTQAPADVQAADEAARAVFESLGEEASALYVGIWDPRRGTFLRAYGHAVRGGAKATVDDSLRIASITKTFTATIVLQLVDEELVDLDGDLADYLPDLAAAHPELAPITVEQLLSMRSGLPDYLENPAGIGADVAADPSRVWTPAELITAALRAEVAKPGTAGYSNTNFVLLQLVVEQVTGKPLRDLITERHTDPLDMRHTALPPDTHTALPEPAAHGYLNQSCIDKAAAAGVNGVTVGTDTTDWNTSFMQGAGGMMSTLADLGKWAATTTGADLLPDSARESRLDTRDIGGVEYGLGIARFGSWYGHDGEALGWQSIALHNPTTGVTFVAAVNACSGMREHLLGLLNTLYPD